MKDSNPTVFYNVENKKNLSVIYQQFLNVAQHKGDSGLPPSGGHSLNATLFIAFLEETKISVFCLRFVKKKRQLFAFLSPKSLTISSVLLQIKSDTFVR